MDDNEVQTISNLEALRQLVEFRLPVYKALAVGSSCTKNGKHKLIVIMDRWGSNYGVESEINDDELHFENLQKLADKLITESVYHLLLAQTQVDIDENASFCGLKKV